MHRITAILLLALLSATIEAASLSRVTRHVGYHISNADLPLSELIAMLPHNESKFMIERMNLQYESTEFIFAVFQKFPRWAIRVINSVQYLIQ